MKTRAFTLAALLVFAVTAAAQRTSVGRDFPIYDNGGHPDLAVDPQRFVARSSAAADGERWRSERSGGYIPLACAPHK